MGEGQVSSTSKMPANQQALVLGGLALCLAVGGGIVFWLIFGGSPSSRTISVDPNTPSRATVRGQPYVQIPGLSALGPNDWSVRASAGGLRVKRGGDGKYDFAYHFIAGFTPDPEKLTLISAADRATKDDAMAAEWGVSTDQQKALKQALSFSAMPPLTAAERDQLSQAFDEMLSAKSPSDRTAQQRKLSQKIDEIVKGKMQPTHDGLDRKIAEIRRILSNSSIDKMLGK